MDITLEKVLTEDYRVTNFAIRNADGTIWSGSSDDVQKYTPSLAPHFRAVASSLTGQQIKEALAESAVRLHGTGRRVELTLAPVWYLADA